MSQNTLQLSHKLLTRFTTTQASNLVVTLPNQSVSPLLLPRQHLSKTCLHLYLCCCFWMFHSQTSRLFHACWWTQAGALLVSTNRTADLHLQVTLPLKMCSQVSIDFHSQVDSPLKTCSRVTVDFHSQVGHLSRRACKCTVDFPSQVTSPLKTCLQVHCDFHSQVSHLSGRACKCTIDLPSRDTSPLKTC